MNIEEISHIKGFGSSDKILNLLATIENQLYGLDLDIENFVGFEKIYFTIGFPQKIKIEVGHGQKTERAQQKNSQQKQSHQCRETEIQQNARTILDASYQGNGGQGSQGKSSATRILSEFFYDIKYEFDRQHVYKRTDNKLEVHIFEYFKYLDFSSGNCEIYNHLSHHLVNLKYYICSHRREENDLVLLVKADTSIFPLHEDKMLIYPQLELNIDLSERKYEIKQNGFFIKWE